MSTRVITYPGPPTSGTGEVSDVCVDINAATWYCTVAGTPGTWVKPTAGSLVPIASQVLSSPAASIDFSNIPGTYNHLKLTVVARSTDAVSAEHLGLTFNGDGGAHYDNSAVDISGVSAPSVNGFGSVGQTSFQVNLVGANATAGVASFLDIEIPIYSQTTFEKAFRVFHSFNDGPNNAAFFDMMNGLWRSTAAINRVTLAPTTGPNFATGSAAYLYGVL